MELRDYLKIIAKSWVIIVALSVVSAFGGYVKARADKPIYQAIVTYQVNQKPQPTNQNLYNFDNYYLGLASANLADAIAGFAASPNAVVAAYQDIGLDIPPLDARKLAKVFHFQRQGVNANSITIFIEDKSSQNAVLLLEALDKKITANFSNKDNSISRSGVALLTKKANVNQAAAIFWLFGLILGIFIALTKEYLKK